MDLNSPLFDSIRIRRTRDEPKTARDAGGSGKAANGKPANGKPAGTCEAEGCTHAGLFRAPKGRRAEGQYWNFCIDHVKAYNATYNYFDGMNDDAVQAFQKDAIIGHRPTWAMGVNRPAAAKAADAPTRDWAY
ncbi:MAG: molecular chaperone DnaJ, partial [Methylobacterium sp.]